MAERRYSNLPGLVGHRGALRTLGGTRKWLDTQVVGKLSPALRQNTRYVYMFPGVGVGEISFELFERGASKVPLWLIQSRTKPFKLYSPMPLRSCSSFGELCVTSTPDNTGGIQAWYKKM